MRDLVFILNNIDNDKKVTLNINSYNSLLLYLEQLNDKKVKEKYNYITIIGIEEIYKYCRKTLENSYNDNVENEIVNNMADNIINIIDNLGYEITYHNLEKGC
ncbi:MULTISPECIES: hypothetical protein [Clostridium]|uniref:Uncharacterized protein n=1 Tax=Clostridium perfringens TaxID=1502 RepID=A0A127EHY9_CLOPF|nr:MULTISPECIES: hypothetical protein [Clostridium]AMN35527.1 hypothetical protein JFP838_07125 [Clostridium perfringens]EJT6340573.1 hypothetical protein [Clostridium perfringens]MDK7589927.1 hypothetical protein [Clostridium sp. UMB9555B]MDK7627679.1 hypothetical protein [Clostridium sp. UMB9555A]